jgi:hypothetical protein
MLDYLARPVILYRRGRLQLAMGGSGLLPEKPPRMHPYPCPDVAVPDVPY